MTPSIQFLYSILTMSRSSGADVKVRHIGGQDQNLPMQFKDIGLVKWRKLLAKYSKEQLDKDDIEAGPKHEAAALSDIIVGWKIANGDGKRLPYNKKNLIKLCGYTWFTQAVISAYSENLTGIVSEPGKGT